MRTTRSSHRRMFRRARSGKVSVDIVLSMSVFFTVGSALFFLARLASDRLHHVISILVGFPYS